MIRFYVIGQQGLDLYLKKISAENLFDEWLKNIKTDLELKLSVLQENEVIAEEIKTVLNSIEALERGLLRLYSYASLDDEEEINFYEEYTNCTACMQEIIKAAILIGNKAFGMKVERSSENVERLSLSVVDDQVAKLIHEECDERIAFILADMSAALTLKLTNIKQDMPHKLNTFLDADWEVFLKKQLARDKETQKKCLVERLKNYHDLQRSLALSEYDDESKNKIKQAFIAVFDKAKGERVRLDAENVNVEKIPSFITFLTNYIKRLQENSKTLDEANTQRLLYATKTLANFESLLIHPEINRIFSEKRKADDALITLCRDLYENLFNLAAAGCRDYNVIQAFIYTEKIKANLDKTEISDMPTLLLEEVLCLKLKAIQDESRGLRKTGDLKQQTKCIHLFNDINRFYFDLLTISHFLKKDAANIHYLEYYQNKLLMAALLKTTNNILSSYKILADDQSKYLELEENLKQIDKFLHERILQENQKIEEKAAVYVAKELSDLNENFSECEESLQLNFISLKMREMKKVEETLLNEEGLDKEKIAAPFAHLQEKLQGKKVQLEKVQRGKIEKAEREKAEFAKKVKEKKDLWLKFRSTAAKVESKPTVIPPLAVAKKENLNERALLIHNAINAYLSPRKAILETPAFKNTAMNTFNDLMLELESLKTKDFTNQEEWKRACEMIQFKYLGWNLAGLMSVLLDSKQVSKVYHPLAKECQEQIANLDKHGMNLLKCKNTTDRAYGLITRDLAADLSFCVNNFFGNVNNLQDPEKQKSFQRLFNKILHSQDKVMKVHRAQFKKLLGDIAKALALTVSLFGLPMYALITGKNPFSLFYRHKTAREDCIEAISNAAPPLPAKSTSAA